MIHDLEQRSDAWRQVRLGKLTASAIVEALATTQGGWGASRANLRARLVCERLTGVPQGGGFCNAAMQFGIDHEAEARDAYAQHRLCPVVEVGFVDHPSIEWAGCSPDGFVDDDGLVELKVPNTATHIETLLNGGLPDKYLKQVLWQMACTGRAWCDLVSFDPRLPEEMRLFVQRIERDDGAIAELEQQAVAFLAEVAETVASLCDRYGVRPFATGSQAVWRQHETL